jgi:hypothetical protein
MKNLNSRVAEPRIREIATRRAFQQRIDRHLLVSYVSKLALEFHNEAGNWFFPLRSGTKIKDKFSVRDGSITVETYITDAGSTSLPGTVVEKRPAMLCPRSRWQSRSTAL